jgi:hypothetical protein
MKKPVYKPNKSDWQSNFLHVLSFYLSLAVDCRLSWRQIGRVKPLRPSKTQHCAHDKHKQGCKAARQGWAGREKAQCGSRAIE